MPRVHGDREGMSEEFKSWNPMQEDFTNCQFNKYSSGPGAELDQALQPGEIANLQKYNKKNDTAPVPYLVFRNMPKNMTKNALWNLCKPHGSVIAVRDSKKNDNFFVDLASIADMESVYRALSTNNYGFQVLVGKHYQKRQQQHGDYGKFSESIAQNNPVGANERPRDKNFIDTSNRKYRASDRNPPRPFIQRSPIINTDNGPKRNDTPIALHRYAVIDDDAHALERAGLQKPNQLKVHGNTKYQYRTGRAYIEMPDKFKKTVEDKNRQSLGHFNAKEGKYENTRPENSSDHAVKLDHIGKCSMCQRQCDVVCARCSTYFCGLECQRKAWPQHRHICGKPKNIQDAQIASISKKMSNLDINATTEATKPFDTQSNASSESSTDRSDNSPPSKTANSTQPRESKAGDNMPRCGNVVTLSAISKANVVFIRSKTYEDNLRYFTLIHEIQAAAKHLKRLLEPPKCGQIVIAKFHGQSNRALVLNTNDTMSIKLIYIDYGNLDVQAFTDLYEAPQRFVEMPRLAIPVLLKDVPDSYLTYELRTFMYSYLDGIDLQVKYKPDEDFLPDKGVYCVELIDEATNQSFNKTIIRLSQPIEPKDPDEIYFHHYLKQCVLPAGDNMKLVVMDNSLLVTGCISCTTREYALEIQKFQRDVQSYGEMLPAQNYAPRVDELCIVKYSVDGKWYRGRCLDLVGDGHPTILFIDYGNIAMVKIEDIRRYPAQFTYPIYTADCEIGGLPEQCSKELIAKLETLIPNGSTIQCDHIHVFEDDNFHTIKLNDVIQQLTADGLLTTTMTTTTDE